MVYRPLAMPVNVAIPESVVEAERFAERLVSAAGFEITKACASRRSGRSTSRTTTRRIALLVTSRPSSLRIVVTGEGRGDAVFGERPCRHASGARLARHNARMRREVTIRTGRRLGRRDTDPDGARWSAAARNQAARNRNVSQTSEAGMMTESPKSARLAALQSPNDR